MENETLINIPLIKNKRDFWEIIRIFQNGILAGNDLFVSTPPIPNHNQGNGSSLPPGLLDSSFFVCLKYYVF